MAILAAVDADSRPDRVVTVGRELSDVFDDELVVLHVVSRDEFERRSEEREYFIDEAARDAARAAGWVVNGTLEDDDGVSLEGHVGEPSQTICQVADDLNARYVVVGGRNRTPVGKAVFGSVTQSVLLHTDRPVVTVID